MFIGQGTRRAEYLNKRIIQTSHVLCTFCPPPSTSHSPLPILTWSDTNLSQGNLVLRIISTFRLITGIPRCVPHQYASTYEDAIWRKPFLAWLRKQRNRDSLLRLIEIVDLHLSKALFSLDPDNLQLHCFLGLGALFFCSFFCPLDQPCKTLQTVLVVPIKTLMRYFLIINLFISVNQSINQSINFI